MKPNSLSRPPATPLGGSFTRRDFLGLAGGVSLLAWAGCATRPAPRSVGIVDTHTHFYDPGRPQGVPFPSSRDSLLYRPVLPGEWQRLVQPLGVTGTVVVEASPWPEDNQWLLDLAANQQNLPGMQGIVGVVGNLPVGTAEFAELLKRFAANPLFRGIRVNGSKLMAGLEQPDYRRDLGRLADRGLALDVNHGTSFAAATAAEAVVACCRN